MLAGKYNNATYIAKENFRKTIESFSTFLMYLHET
jgi:hypothetical protein